ncbi:hypothetical protein D1867_02320 [Acidianus infernus]|uniref:A-type ATP synthase subunit E n=1 Tax=Acidianus infernus TaxID=12915 RepID=A0A6A9QEA5_ACIIN|nr:V-type ATP synthase subunit E [Acidianus infernus]MCY0874452.1 V-type ATP synthase subunit E [Acidianus infernus]MCY0883697.1 V-type ATP synthase subunit E [Acidianus infernus]MUM64103.1 hypothetical protein [Acidianus infernus]
MELNDLLDYATKKVMEEIRENLEQALAEANKIIENKYNDILSDYDKKIRDLISKRKEQIEGEKAKLDVENKRAILNEENYWLQKVYDEVVKNINVVTSSKEYAEGLQSIIKKEISSSITKAKIICNKNDVEVVKKILKDNKLSADVEEDDNLLGGIKIYYPDVGLVKDYSLNLILSQVFESVKPKVAEILFGGENGR